MAIENTAANIAFKRLENNTSLNLLMILSYFFGIYFVLLAIYIYATRFEKTITVSEKYQYASGGGRRLTINNSVQDQQGNVYRVSNQLLLLHFTAAEVLMNIRVGASYTVRGYGIRIPALGLYPVITEAKAVSS